MLLTWKKIGRPLALLALASVLAVPVAVAQEAVQAPPKVALTPAEQAFLKAHPVIRLGVGEDWEPYVVRKPSGELTGFDIDLLRLLSEVTGANLQMEAGEWSKVVKRAEARGLDGLALSAASKPRGEHFRFSTPYLTVYPAFVVAEKNQRTYSGIDDFAGEKVAVLAGNKFHLLMLAEHPKVTVVEYPTDTEAISAVLEGKAAAAVIAAPLFDRHYKKFSKLIRVGFVATNHPLRLLYSIRKDWPELVAILNKGLAAIPVEEFNLAYYRWFGTDPPETNPESIAFTPAEKAWLEKKYVVRARVGQSPPFHSADGGVHGLSVDLFNEISRRAGFKVEYVTGVPWSEALSDIRQRRTIDLLLTAVIDPEKMDFLAFTKEYTISPSVIFTRDDSPFVSSIESLSGGTIVVEQNFVTKKLLEREFPSVKLLLRTTTEEALHSLAVGEADAYIGNLTISTYLIKTRGLDNLKVAAPAPPSFTNNQAMAVRSDWPELAGIISKTLDSLTPEEQATITNRWLPPVRYEYGISGWTLVKWVAGVSAFLLLVIGGVLLWNNKLAVEIVARKKAEARLSTSEEKYRTLFERSADAILIIEGDRFVDCNAATVDMLGYPSKEMFLNAHPWELSPPLQPDGRSSDEKAAEMIARALDAGSHRFEWTHSRANGDPFPAEVLLTAISKEEPPVLHVVWRDITVRRQAEEALQQLTVDLTRTNLELERFTYTVSHDLKSPLITIMGFIGLLEKGLGDEQDDDTRSAIDFIRSAATKMSALLDSLLEVSRIGRVVNLAETINLEEVTREALELVSGPLAESRATVTVASGLPLVSGDRLRLRQVMQNLIENGIKYSKGQASPQIEVGVAEVDGKRACFVRDNGLGIPPEHHERVFGLFARLDQSQAGTGVGLTLVKRIIELHGGKVWLDSTGVPGEGTTVWFTLPWQETKSA